MLPRQLPSLFVGLGVLFLSAFAVHELRRPSEPPHTLADLTELLSRSPARLHVVQQTKTSVEGGIYVCVSPRPHEELHNLIRVREYASEWRGVAFCEHMGSNSEIPVPFVESWGENGIQLGGFRLFGDPAVLRQIQAAVRQSLRR